MRRRIVPALLSLVVAVDAVSGDLSAPATGQAFTVEDLVTLRRVSSPQVSPDGRHVAFVVRETELHANRARTSVWLLELAGSNAAARRVTQSTGSESSPRWAPDGRSLYFLSSRSGSSQIWRLPFDSTSEAQQVTAYPLDVGTFKLSPDGKRIALTLQTFPDCELLECTVSRLAARAGNQAKGQLYDALFVRHWDSWKDGRLFTLFTAVLGSDFKLGEPINVSREIRGDVLPQLGGGEEYDFSPDGSRLVFATRLAGRGEAWSTNFDLYEAAADGSDTPVNITADNLAWDAQPVFLGNGDLAYLAMQRPGFEADRFRVVLRDARTGATRTLTENWDRTVRRLSASGDRRNLLATADDMGQLSLFSIDTSKGNVERIVGQGQVSDFSPLPAGGAMVAWGSLASPTDLFVATRKAAPLRRVTAINADLLAGHSLSSFEQFAFPGWNDEKVHGYVIRPAGFRVSGKYPIAFIVHGGPQSSMQNQWNWRWNAQAFAAQGYAVILIDFHGSTGYGQSFTDSISKDWGGKPLIDLQKGLAAALAKYEWLDGERVCSLGASYGGYLQNWIAVRWPERFKCLVNHAGVFDTRMGAYTTDELWFTEWENGGTYYDNPQGNEAFNPANHVTNWRTPTLLTYGALDYRVPYLQGLAAFTALQRMGVESRFLYFPDENHWVLKPANTLQWYRTVFDWLDRHLKQAVTPGEGR